MLFKNIVLFTLILVGFSDRSCGYSLLLSSRVDQGVDVFGVHNFHLNPASYRLDPFSVQLSLFRTRSSSTYKQAQGNNNFQQNSQRMENYLAAGVMADAGGGLWFGANIEQLKSETKSSRSDINNQQIPESSDSRLSSGKAVVELTEMVSVGFSLRFLEVERSLVGAFGVNPLNAITTFKTTLFGSGGGLLINNQNKFVLAANYFPAMKGKSDILGEEKIIIEPGNSDVGVGFTLKDEIKAGFIYRRWLYKKDDRVEGTTLNNNNQTRVNLYGLDIEQTNIFPTSVMILGISYPIDKNLKALASIARENLVFIESVSQNLPGENDDDPKAARNIYKILLLIQRAKINFMAGLNFVRGTVDFSSTSRAIARSLEVNRQDVWLSIGSTL